jgi:geranylgeranyl pyrophosphate synthase
MPEETRGPAADRNAAGPLAAFGSEHARGRSAIEWWFVHGRYGSGRRVRDFMATLFRLSFAEEGEAPRGDGFQLLLAVLDPEATQHRCSTWTDAAVVRTAIEKAKSRDARVDPVVQRALIAELEASGPLHPVQVPSAQVAFEAAPLDARWGSFALAQTDASFTLRFEEPGTGTPVALTLEADAGMLDLVLPADAARLGDGYAHRCYPRVRLSGRAGNEDVSGDAWIDHQWGGTGWLYDASGEHLHGWDWFGINLEDGSDWVVMRMRDVATGEILAMNATTRGADGTVRHARAFDAAPLRSWESPATHVRYPVEWRLDIPALDATFTFRPRADAQELAAFGTIRAVWEGAGTVTGRVGGEAVRGRARGEFHGYGYVLDYDAFLGRLAERVDRHLEALLPRRFELADVERFVGPAAFEHEPDAYTDTLATPVWDLIERSGKRWRPIFGILMAEAFGMDYERFEGLGSVTSELLHTGALIVDDVQDGSTLRRGEETLHLRYGVDVALNAGNALYFLPAVELMGHPDLDVATRLRLHEIKERVCIESHCGQATDIYWSRTLTPERLDAWLEGDIEAKILQMYALKTGAGARGIAESVALVGRIDGATAAAAKAFAQAFAVAFQITDDVLNFSRSPRWTKTRGEDVAAGKLTYVITTALRRLGAAERARLTEILCSPKARGDAGGLREAIALVQASGALEAGRERAREMLEAAWNAFAAHLRPSEPKVMLHALCLSMLDLAYDA